MNINYVLFDLDVSLVILHKYCIYNLHFNNLKGLLIDSEKVYTNVTNDILKPFNKQFNWKIKSQMMGKHERVASEYLINELQLPISIDDYLQIRNQKQFEAWPYLELKPGALKLVKHLVNNKIPIAVATGSRRESLNHKIKAEEVKHLISLFGDNVITADDVPIGKGKPLPDIFLLAAQKIGVDVNVKENLSHGLVFEDAIPGVQAGLNANMNG